MAAVEHIINGSKNRRRKTGVILAASPVLNFGVSSEGPEIQGNSDITTPDNTFCEIKEQFNSNSVSLHCELNTSVEDIAGTFTDEATKRSIANSGNGSKQIDSLSKLKTPKQRKVRIQTGPERSTEDRPQTAISDSTKSGNATKGIYDAKSEKSVSYMTAGGKTMKTSTMYQESTKGNDDVLQARSKLRQLQINYSKTNATLNDRVIMCDILRVTHNQVIPRIKLIHSLERRLHNHRQHSRRQIAINGKKSKELANTVADMKKAREERIKQKQTIPRKIDTLKAITAHDIEKLRNCRYLRVSDRQESDDCNV